MRLYRQGRKVGHTIYLMVGDEPSDGDLFIGSCATVDEATKLVIRANRPDPPQQMALLADMVADLSRQVEALTQRRMQWHGLLSTPRTAISSRWTTLRRSLRR